MATESGIDSGVIGIPRNETKRNEWNDPDEAHRPFSPAVPRVFPLIPFRLVYRPEICVSLLFSGLCLCCRDLAHVPIHPILSPSSLVFFCVALIVFFWGGGCLQPVVCAFPWFVFSRMLPLALSLSLSLSRQPNDEQQHAPEAAGEADNAPETTSFSSTPTILPAYRSVPRPSSLPVFPLLDPSSSCTSSESSVRKRERTKRDRIAFDTENHGTQQRVLLYYGVSYYRARHDRHATQCNAIAALRAGGGKTRKNVQRRLGVGIFVVDAWKAAEHSEQQQLSTSTTKAHRS